MSTGTRIVKVILPAGQVPLGSTVCKRSGAKEYKLLDHLRVFGEERREVKAQPGCRFMVSEGDAEAIPDTLEILWLATDDALLEYLDPPEDK